MDEAREFFRQDLFIAEAPFLHTAGLEILDQDIRILQQPEQNFLPLASANIKRDGALVAVGAAEIGGEALVVVGRTPAARFIALRQIGRASCRERVSMS